MIKLFTHTDLDGIGCAVLAKLAFGENVDISYCDYGNINANVEEFLKGDFSNIEECHITDISIKDHIAKQIDDSELKGLFTLMDHHATAEYLNRYDWCRVSEYLYDSKTSGTELYYRWLVENDLLKNSVSIYRFVSFVRNYDTWKWPTMGDLGLFIKQMNDLLYIYGREKFIDWCINKINNGTIFEFDSYDEILLNYRQKEIDTYIEAKDKQLYITEFGELKYGVVYAERFFSELGNKLCELHPELDFVAMIDISAGKISYRTVKNYLDVGKDVAKLLGGGGHPKAAGSTFSSDLSKEIIERLMKVPEPIDWMKKLEDSVKNMTKAVSEIDKNLKIIAEGIEHVES